MHALLLNLLVCVLFTILTSSCLVSNPIDLDFVLDVRRFTLLGLFVYSYVLLLIDLFLVLFRQLRNCVYLSHANTGMERQLD